MKAKAKKSNEVKTPTINAPKVQAASKVIVVMIKEKPGFYQRRSVIKALAKKFDKKTVNTALDNLRGHGKAKQQVTRVSGYALLEK